MKYRTKEEPTMIERIAFHLKQTNNLSEIAKQISKETATPRSRKYVFWYVKTYNIPQPLKDKALKSYPHGNTRHLS